MILKKFERILKDAIENEIINIILKNIDFKKPFLIIKLNNKIKVVQLLINYPCKNNIILKVNKSNKEGTNISISYWE